MAAALFLAGCTPEIGDKCTLSTQCSAQGNRICDTSQPNGYCTVFSCSANSCPGNSACIEFGASVPGCAYDDYGAPSRVARSICMRTCAGNSDCRQSEGYVCADPADPKQTLSTVILDTKQPQRVCMIGSAFVSLAGAQVCSSNKSEAPPLDATVPMPQNADTGTDSQDAPGEDADMSPPLDGAVGSDAHVDGTVGGDAHDDATDAQTDGVDVVPADVTLEAATDSGAADAPDGN